MHKVKLAKPVTGIDGNEVKEVVVSEITGRMYLKFGDLMLPEVRTDGNVEKVTIKTDQGVLLSYIEATTNLPAPIIQEMAPADIAKIKAIIQGFFQDFQ